MPRTASETGIQVDTLLGCAREDFEGRLAPDDVEAHAVGCDVGACPRSTARETNESARAGPASALGTGRTMNL